MRIKTQLYQANFIKGSEVTTVTLPHTWNALDGQDGGYDYYRGACKYEIALPNPSQGMQQFIEFEGANHQAEVFCNGQRLGIHKGGFSTFRFELTEHLSPSNNVLTVVVDNQCPDIYPQKADFTFFGGLYRPVHFVEVTPAHFDLLKNGTQGVFVTPRSTGRTRIDAFVVNREDCNVHVALKDASGAVVAEADHAALAHTVFEVQVDNPALWNGTVAPTLYTAEIQLLKNGQVVDAVEQRYGYRSFHVDPNSGFYLNGASYPLHGVARHQDRKDKGWAISEEDHKQDMELIQEIGANTLRLAHYQHSQYFYDLCDEAGMVVWAEIPFISALIPGEAAKDNTLSQMQELIAQNYHHPSICFWGIGNELTMGGEPDELYLNLMELNALAKKLDPSRMTTIAHLSAVNAKHPHNFITDLLGYNIYLGWYMGEISDNGPHLDNLYRMLPDTPLSVTEYGADALIKWHSASPKNHDYTEEYQALYHESMLQIFETRPYLWATFAWNMFDFAADARNEGGAKGFNSKGLVTYDRTVKKDAFYAYKAAWTTDPMVHLCGRRFTDRAPGQWDVKVYTNCSQVALILNGTVLETKEAQHHVCVFHDVPLRSGSNTLIAEAECIRDEMILNGVDTANKDYELPPEAIVAGNWFDEETGETMCLQFPEGFCSIHDTMGELMANPQAAAVFGEYRAMLGSTGRNTNGAGGADARSMIQMVKSFSLEQLLKVAGVNLSPIEIIKLNNKLNRIPKNS